MSNSNGLLQLTSALTVLPGCAGFRGGWESVPYLGETPPSLQESRTPYEAQRRNELKLPGMTLGVSINDQLRTYDTQVYLFVLPLSVDPRSVQTQRIDTGRTRVSIRISDVAGDLVFRPRAARLTVGTQTVEGIAGLEFAIWNQQGQKVSAGGQWEHRSTGDESVLPMQSKAYLLSIDFPLPPPSPESRDISLDLSKALTSTQLPSIPVIRFAPVRWKEGYT